MLHVNTPESIAVENASPYGNSHVHLHGQRRYRPSLRAPCKCWHGAINIGVPVPREPCSFGGWNESQFGTGDITGDDGIAFWTRTKKVTQKWTPGAARNWMS